MSKKLHVVAGEASESDTEDEVITKAPETPQRIMTESGVVKNYVVPGEASESSDDDTPVNYARSNPRSLQSASSTAQSTPARQKNVSIVKHDSLLHRKLWENNVCLRSTVESLLHHTAALAAQKLGEADQMLLSAQESMRGTNANMRLALARLRSVHTGLQNANCQSLLTNLRTR